MIAKRIALFIALGSIIIGIIVCFWPPKPCEDVSTVLPCLNRLVQMINGFPIFVSGITLLILISITNLRYRTLAMIGVILNFVIAIVFLGSTAFGIHFSTVFWMFDPVEPLKTILAIGFLSAALSASVIKKIASGRVQTESSGKTL